MTTSRLLRAAALATGLALAVSACGPSESAQPSRTEPAPGSTLIPSLTPTTLASAAGKPCVAPVDVPPAEGKPEVPVPEGPPPTELVVEDLVVGEGEEIGATDSVSMQYVGIACSTGAQFDASWDRGAPFDLALGQGQVIQGWEEGVPGMRVGGRRLLVIPPDMAYGPDGRGDIAPDETLIFVVDVVAKTDPAATTTAPAAP